MKKTCQVVMCALTPRALPIVFLLSSPFALTVQLGVLVCYGQECMGTVGGLLCSV